MYDVLLERNAEKDLRKQPKKVFKQIILQIKLLADVPRPKYTKKLIDYNNFWRIRIGSYRVIYEIIDSSETIRIYKIKHRKDVYK